MIFEKIEKNVFTQRLQIIIVLIRQNKLLQISKKNISIKRKKDKYQK